MAIPFYISLNCVSVALDYNGRHKAIKFYDEVLKTERSIP